MAAIPRRSGYRALITTELADYFIDFEHNHGIKLDADQRAWYGHAEKDRSRLHAQGVPELSGGGLQGFNRGGLLQDVDDQGPRGASTTGPAMAATPCKSEPAASFPSISRHRMTGTKVSRGRHQRGQHEGAKETTKGASCLRVDPERMATTRCGHRPEDVHQAGNMLYSPLTNHKRWAHDDTPQEEDSSRPVSSAWAHLSQSGHVAASAD